MKQLIRASQIKHQLFIRIFIRKRYFDFLRAIAAATYLVVGIAIALSSARVAWAESAELDDVPYRFDQQKLLAAKDPFHFARSFVDYFYLVVKVNKNNLPKVAGKWTQSGWCVGDAHPENFGYLLNDSGKTQITMNDLDDGGPCPVVLDLVRLAVTAKLYSPKIEAEKLLKAYVMGLRSQKMKKPKTLKKAKRQSVQLGLKPRKSRVTETSFNRSSSDLEVSENLRKEIFEKLAPIVGDDDTIIDLVQTRKVGGGSGGLLRYEVLLNNGRRLLHLELKQQVDPAVMSLGLFKMPAVPSRISQLVELEQGQSRSRYYSAIEVGSMPMLVRPIYAGDIGVDLSANDEKTSRKIIYYEAYLLGRIHARGLPHRAKGWADEVSQFKSADFEEEVSKLNLFFSRVYQDNIHGLNHQN